MPGASAATPAATGTAPTWQDDPILAQIKALAQSGNASAQAQYDDAKRRALISYGYDPTLSSLYGDPTTQAAAQANPFSTLAQLLQAHTSGVHNLDENLNKGNLYYGSYRGQQLGQENRNYQQSQYNAGQQLQSNLTGLSGALLAAQGQNAANVQQGNTDAYGRALDFQLQYGGSPVTATPAPVAQVASPLAAALPSSKNISALRRKLLSGKR